MKSLVEIVNTRASESPIWRESNIDSAKSRVINDDNPVYLAGLRQMVKRENPA